MPKYRNNYKGISISKGYGRINISQDLINYLKKPRVLTFQKLNEDWLRIIPFSCDVKDSREAKIEFMENKGGGFRFFINDAALVKGLFDDYGIIRYNEYQFSPFYIIDYRNANGIPYVDICMNHFSDYV